MAAWGQGWRGRVYPWGSKGDPMVHKSASYTHPLAVFTLSAGCCLWSACGDGGGRGGGQSAGGTGTVGGSAGSVTVTASAGSGSGGTSSAGGSGSGGSGGASTTSTTSASGGDSGPPKFDLGVLPDAGGGGCGGGGGGGEPEFSYIWIANSGQGTVSKIDTQTLQELGRYVVRPDGGGSPSRTSVSLSGDVAVASRLGGVTKIYARSEDCQDTNGTPGIQTATDANYLPWGQEECVAWHTPINLSTQRPVAWAPGDLNPVTCEYENEKLWVAGGQNNQTNSVQVYRLNGSDGSIDAMIAMPDVPMGYFGPYGGAVNADGDFWFITYDGSPRHLVRVDAQTLMYEKFPIPAELSPYGFTVDSKGRPWIGSFSQVSARFDPTLQQWDTFAAHGYGIQEDAMGRMWLADFSLGGVREIDSDSLALGAAIPLGSNSVKGVSIDFYGYVWVVDMSQSAFRVDPDAQTYDVFNQLVGPYTYSDMTGWGLSNVAFPPG